METLTINDRGNRLNGESIEVIELWHYWLTNGATEGIGAMKSKR